MPYEDSYDKLEKAMNLSDEEVRIFKDMREKQVKASSEYSFRCRELAGKPDGTVTIKVGDVTVKGVTRDAFEWLRFIVVRAGWDTPTGLTQKIFEAGVQMLYNNNVEGAAGAVLRSQLLAELPEEVGHAMQIKAIRSAIEAQKKLEEIDLQAQFDAPAKEGKE